MMSTSSAFSYRSESIIDLMIDLRFSYAVVSSGLILVGFFWNNLHGFSLEYVTLIVSIFCANVFMFVVNDYYDAPHDQKDPVKQERNVFCSPSTKQTGKIVLYTSVGLSLVLSGTVSLSIFLIVVFLDLLALAYSSPQIKLRNRMYWDWIFVFLWKGLIIAPGYIYFFGTDITAMNSFMCGTLIIIMLSSWINQLDNQIRDFEVDKLNNTGHSSQRLGHKTSLSLKLILSIFFFGFSLVFCYLMHLHIAMALIAINLSLYCLVNPVKYSIVLEFTNIWIVVIFLEHFLEAYSHQQQLLFSGWVVAMACIAVFHAKRYDLFGK